VGGETTGERKSRISNRTVFRMLLISSRATRRLRRTLVTLLAAVTVLLPLLAVAGPAQASGIRRTATERAYSLAVLRVLNAERRLQHLVPLRYDSKLRLAARRHNLTMARANTLSHQLPGELSFTARIDRAGYHWTYAGENIGWNSSMTERGVVALQKLMYREKPPNDGHRRNILSRHFRNVGVDVYLDRAHHKVWLTTDWGRL
jgi:uncharacterized protein YkwD